jgi:serine/threonine protein kinase
MLHLVADFQNVVGLTKIYSQHTQHMGGGPSKKQRSTKLQQQNTTTTDDEAQWIGLGDDDSRAADRQNKESSNLPRRRSESVDLSVRSSGTDYEEEQVDSEASTNDDEEVPRASSSLSNVDDNNKAIMDKTYYHTENRVDFSRFSQNDVTCLNIIGGGAFGVIHLVALTPSAYKKSQNQQSSTVEKTYALKTLIKANVVALNQQKRVIIERNILAKCSRTSHPFICRLVATFQDEDCLYMMMELLQGGDLYSALQSSSVDYSSFHTYFSPARTKFYAASIVEALTAVHELNIIFRDLKPENLVLSKNGYAKLVDFGCSRMDVLDDSDSKPRTLCGTAEYIAPGMVLGKGHGKGVDWWAMGVVLYEFHHGDVPFTGDTPTETYTNILTRNMDLDPAEDLSLSEAEQAEYRNYMSMVNGLLTVDVNQRIGCSFPQSNAFNHGIHDEVRNHEWFVESGFQWDDFQNMTMSVPDAAVPVLNGPTDISAFTESEAPGEVVIAPYDASKCKDMGAWCAVW